jgi:phosphoesterase RecJ-like protein
MRSNTDWSVSSVCARFGGGGHVRAAGCSVEAPTIEEAERKILSAIRDLMK